MALTDKLKAITDKLKAIADATREKTGKSGSLTLEQIAADIAGISVGGAPNLQAKNVVPSTSAQTIKPDSGYDGLSQVVLNPIQTEQKTATANGDVVPSSGKFLSRVVVNVSPSIPTGFTKFASGTVTFGSDNANAKGKTVTHGLGVLPKYLVFWCDPAVMKNNVGVRAFTNMIDVQTTGDANNYAHCTHMAYFPANGTPSSGRYYKAERNTTYDCWLTENTFALKPYTTSYPLLAGTYHWIAAA